MDNLIAVSAAILYVLAIATIIPGLVQQTVHAWSLSDLIFSSYGQNLSILNVASLISFIVSLVMSVAMLKTRIWFLLPVVYSFSAINLCAANTQR